MIVGVGNDSLVERPGIEQGVKAKTGGYTLATKIRNMHGHGECASEAVTSVG
jgi:hypothetical protein